MRTALQYKTSHSAFRRECIIKRPKQPRNNQSPLLSVPIFRIAQLPLYMEKAVIFHRSAISHRIAVCSHLYAQHKCGARMKVYCQHCKRCSSVVGGGYLAGSNEDEFLGPFPSSHSRSLHTQPSPICKSPQ
jgi:hypothetical protein